ncbi:MAG: phosphate signaling complex protein PhoU [Candidatus Dadabacteria bacterium]|nr:phosphate signaling complex protein PhoU [Candidatus Dadabacteria bacterium]
MIRFEEELNNLNKLMLQMATVAEEMITKSIKSLVDRNIILAEEIIKMDDRVNDMEIEIDNLCIKIQALYHPEAEYLRTVIMILKINNDLERIGDHAVNIAEKVIYLSDKPPVKPLIDIPRMADKSVEMLKNSLKAFIDKDSELAVEVCKNDDEVDILDKQVMRELISYMVSDPRTIDRALALIFIARDLERVADLATNISEDVYYIVQGKSLKHHAIEN